MLKVANERVESLREKEIEKGIKRMEITMNHEIGRLASLHEKKKHIRIEEVRIALDVQAKLTTMIKNARVRMDAMQLIREGD
jgi:ATP-dependent helicase HepA